MKTLLHTAAPFLLLAVCFAALMQQAQYGFIQGAESSVVYALQLMVNGVLPPGDLGSAFSSAPLFVPFYMLWVKFAGESDGFIYFARLVVTTLSFVAALAICQVGSRSEHRTVFLLLAVSVMAFSSVRLLGIALGLGVVLFAASGLLAWCAGLQSLFDDGTQTGYARVLTPFFAGFLLMLAITCSWYFVFPALLVAFAASAWLRRRRRGIVPLVWVGAGILVCVIILLIYLLGFQDPAVTIALYFDSLRVGGGDFLLGKGRLMGPCAVCCSLVFALILGAALAYCVGKLPEKAAVPLVACALALCLAAQALWLVSVRLDCNQLVEEGPAANLIITSQEQSVYDDAAAIARDVGSETVKVYASNQWFTLMFANASENSVDSASWVFVASDIAVDFTEDFMDTHALLLENSAGVLYRAASKQSFITQG